MDTSHLPYELDSVRNIRIFHHPTATPLSVRIGESTDGVEITSLVESSRQSSQEVSCTLAYHDELYGDNQPVAGQVLEIRLEGRLYWIGIIQAISDYQLSSGSKRMSIVARTRDATPAWRDVQRVTPTYPVGTDLDFIARDILYGMGLQEVEIDIPSLGMSVVQSNMQMADIPPWQMLSTLFLPAGMEPFVDAKGRVRAISRDTQRQSDVVFSDNTRLKSISGSRSRPTISEVRIKWLDPNLTEVNQVDKVLGTATITAGFFSLTQRKRVSFSDDHSQRARNTRLVIRQSANAGLLPVCSESYNQVSLVEGEVVLTTYAWVPALATGLIALKVAAHKVPDGVIVSSGGSGHTIPIGRKQEGYIDVAIMLTLMQIGTGMYEIWGTPFDSVHARNTTTAYNTKAKQWETNVLEIENDLVMNEEGAQAFAIRELVYAVRSTDSWKVNIVDDPRIEKGDIVELANGERIYVVDYSRDLSPGSPALLEITGFRC